MSSSRTPPTSLRLRARSREIASDCLAARARGLDRMLARIYDGELRRHGVTSSQLGMLVAIDLACGTTAAEIGRRLELERSTVSRNLARLIAAGLVDTGDGLRTTAAGAATIKACHAAWREAQRKATAVLGMRRLRLLADVPGRGSDL